MKNFPLYHPRQAILLVIALLLLLHPARAAAGEAKGVSPAEWEKILQAARKEGQITVYGSEVYDSVFRHFQKRYPEIKVVAVVGGGNRLIHRAMGERRAGQFLIDLYLSGSGTAHDVLLKANVLDPVKPMLLLPEVVDESKWWGSRHKYVDARGEYIFAFNGLSQSYFQYNTKMVDPKEFSSYWDFVNPKWRGKILIMDPTSGGGVTGVLRFLYRT